MKRRSKKADQTFLNAMGKDLDSVGFALGRKLAFRRNDKRLTPTGRPIPVRKRAGLRLIWSFPYGTGTTDLSLELSRTQMRDLAMTLLRWIEKDRQMEVVSRALGIEVD